MYTVTLLSVINKPYCTLYWAEANLMKYVIMRIVSRIRVTAASRANLGFQPPLAKDKRKTGICDD